PTECGNSRTCSTPTPSRIPECRRSRSGRVFALASEQPRGTQVMCRTACVPCCGRRVPEREDGGISAARFYRQQAGKLSRGHRPVLDKARIDPGLIASLRERSRPLRPEASLTQPFTPLAEEVEAEERLQPLITDLIMRLERAEERLRQLENSHVGKEVAAHTLFLSR